MKRRIATAIGPPQAATPHVATSAAAPSPAAGCRRRLRPQAEAAG
ncbi:MAG: hypothetical protein ACOYM2_03470 [Rectinemataceae bacterium]